MKPSLLAAAAVAALLLAPAAARALELPDMKPGLWQTTIQRSTGDKAADKPQTMTQCLDATALAEAKKTAQAFAKKSCSRNETRREGARWVSDLVCKVGDSTMTNHSVTTFDGDGAYHTEMNISFVPPTAGQSKSATLVDGKWLGACKASAR